MAIASYQAVKDRIGVGSEQFPGLQIAVGFVRKDAGFAGL